MSRRTNNTDLADEAPEFSPEMPPESEDPAQAETLPTRLIYAGPNIPGGILHRFQVFKGGLPPYCKDLFEKIPEIKELFIPVEYLEVARQKIEEPGSNEARLFHMVQQKLNKGGEIIGAQTWRL